MPLNQSIEPSLKSCTSPQTFKTLSKSEILSFHADSKKHRHVLLNSVRNYGPKEALWQS